MVVSQNRGTQKKKQNTMILIIGTPRWYPNFGKAIMIVTIWGSFYNIRDILGLYWDNGKENGNYHGIIRVYRDYSESPYSS